MARAIKLPNGKIGHFPDDMPDDQIEAVMQKQFGLQSAIEPSPFTNREKPQHGTFYNLMRGIGQGYPHAIKGDVNAVSELFGRQPFEQEELEQGPLSQSIGQGLGQLGGHITAVAPIAAAGEAAIPGLVGASLGAGAGSALITPGDWKDRLISGIIGAALPSAIKGTKEAGKLGMAAIRRAPKPRQAADIIQNQHLIAEKFATEPLNLAKAEAAKIAKPKRPIRLSNKILAAAEDALANSKANRELIGKARKGDYKSVFKLQSDLWKRGKSFSSKQTQAEQDRGAEIFDLRNGILEGMKAHYNYLGKNDISKNLSEGQKRYREFADLWSSNSTISKLVGEEKKVPKNLLSQLARDEAFFNKFKKEVPQIEEMLNLIESKKQLKEIGKTIGKLGGTAALAKYLISNESHHPSRD
jgi:hypothetical protein